ncbi:uncharacterized protein NECHADRAFT_88782 [Fusarium vanettenii 77-13-4]|uniref:Zn(2)-C6 fungal-type domain-containing protein n=1 Tax=Fusarium vanettenii (strain ATCC MYA-4622 / CBS 123669 / FGSC 9596 / NRRL 45880 / 77-13-4) TaxID=660122 RepID=C7ZKE3_FUSV7|nr:uncharacterized protein NECHADRAFT_88782 [Fusarium vanettenii 77-13-4]EEU35508.1 hypothetical protein NECHADRAFT_88782 [Fusarium vanettenii 77-13-4]
MSSPKPRFKTACRICRERKVKCDRELPCHNCIIADNACSYPPQVRTVRRPKKAAMAKRASPVGSASLVDRLNRLESYLRRHAPMFELTDGDDDFATSDINSWIRKSNSSDDASQGQDHLLGTGSDHAQEALRRPSGSIPDSVSLTAYDEAIRRPRSHNGDLEKSPLCSQSPEIGLEIGLSATSTTPISPEPDAPSPLHEAPPKPASSPTGFPLRQHQDMELPQLLPTSYRAFCWKRYAESVDPLVKIIHRPSTRELMLVQVQDGQRLHPASMALIQSACLISITSMSEEDVIANLRCDKETLRRTCSARTEQALTAANFLDTRDLRTMQAFLLYLYYLKCMGDSRLRALHGVAVHLSLRMGLNRDPHSYNLASLDVELRRRLWWQLITLVDHPDNSGLDSFHRPLTLESDTRIPLNVDDDDLTDGVVYAVSGSSGFTDTSFSLIQYEITQSFNQTLLERGTMTTTLTRTVNTAEERLRHFGQNLNTKYFLHSGSQEAFRQFAVKTSALILTKRCFLSYLFPGNTSQSIVFGDEKTESHVFRLGVEVLDLSRKIQRTKAFEKWRWLHGTYFQWAAANFVVKQLPFRAQDSTSNKAWLVLDGIFDHWPESIQRSERAIVLKKLIAEACNRRGSLTTYETSSSQDLHANFLQFDEDLLQRRKRGNDESFDNLIPELEFPMLPSASLSAILTDNSFHPADLTGDMLGWDFSNML